MPRDGVWSECQAPIRTAGSSRLPRVAAAAASDRPAGGRPRVVLLVAAAAAGATESAATATVAEAAAAPAAEATAAATRTLGPGDLGRGVAQGRADLVDLELDTVRFSPSGSRTSAARAGRSR